MRAARFEVARRRGSMRGLGIAELNDIALQSADDALVALLSKLEHFGGRSRFTTWAYKFALLETSVKLRRRAWRGRELPLEEERGPQLADRERWPQLTDGGLSPHTHAEQNELLRAVRSAIDCELTAHQREVLLAVALAGVPIDVLAERLGTTRGALYKTIHDARKKLRRKLEADGHDLGSALSGEA
jgi:RNA polymerase sigma-70 factor (ECF subfamily)